jgi:hypothetical protein
MMNELFSMGQSVIFYFLPFAPCTMLFALSLHFQMVYRIGSDGFGYLHPNGEQS